MCYNVDTNDKVKYYRLEDTWGSDHFPIVFEWDDIEDYGKKMRRDPQIWTNTQGFVILDRLEILLYIPRRKDLRNRGGRTGNNSNSRKQQVKWWEECQEAIKNRKESLKRFMSTKTMSSFVEYKRCRAVARKTIREKKRKEFEEFCVIEQTQ
ncbi:hypothetical protein P5V15_007023 [Pogonomyrmex californicus]